MSLYNMIHGVNPAAGYLLAKLNIKHTDLGRFRDISICEDPKNKGEYLIKAFTRNGGGNRPDYEHIFTSMQAHPMYIRDEDDDYDPTYASIYFKIPEEVLQEIKDQGLTLEEIAENETFEAKSEAVLEALRKESESKKEGIHPDGSVTDESGDVIGRRG